MSIYIYVLVFRLTLRQAQGSAQLNKQLQASIYAGLGWIENMFIRGMYLIRKVSWQ
jgi:hypothetical protein